jgi:opacity protein-like surface antigen
MSSFKAGGASKSNTPFSIGIGKGIMKNNTGNVLLEASLMTGEKYDYDFGWGLNWKFQAEMKMAAFASLYYQLNVASIAALKPYVGAGLGLAQLKYTSSGWYYGDSSTSGIGFAWQFALGADYFFNKNIAAGLGYAIRDYGSLEGLKMQSSGLFLGATYKF